MPPPRTRKPHSLTSQLDTKVLGLVRWYIDDAVDEGNTSIFHKKTGTLSLGTSQLYQYIVSAGDGSLQRTKKALLEKSIERAIEVINAEQEKPAKKTTSSTRATSVAPTTTLKVIDENTATMLPPTEATNGDAALSVSPKKRKEKSSPSKEGKEGSSTKRRKGLTPPVHPVNRFLHHTWIISDIAK